MNAKRRGTQSGHDSIISSSSGCEVGAGCCEHKPHGAHAHTHKRKPVKRTRPRPVMVPSTKSCVSLAERFAPSSKGIPVSYQMDNARNPETFYIPHGDEEHRPIPGTSQEAVRSIMEPDTNYLVYNEKIPPQITSLYRVLADHPSVSVDIQIDRSWGWNKMRKVVHQFTRIALSKANGVHPGQCNILAADILGMVKDFYAADSEPRHAIMRIEITDRHGCVKFHTDSLRLRAIRTYFGNGTEFVPNEGVDRPMIQKMHGVPFTVANQKIIPDFSKIRVTGPGDILYMKGNTWDKHGGCVHRSPPKDGWETTRRLLVKIDTGRSGCAC